MSISVQQILALLQTAAPQELALDWDNVGLLVDAGTPVDGVLTTLDITPAVVREAAENDCQLIVSHHPVIFHPIKRLAAADVPAQLMKNGISAICMHSLHSGVRYVTCDKPDTRLAEVSGGGGSYLQEAIDRGADCLVTGEAAHHIALLAKERGVGLVVAGHWGTEHAIADVLAARISAAFPQLTVAHAESDKDPYSYLL